MYNSIRLKYAAVSRTAKKRFEKLRVSTIVVAGTYRSPRNGEHHFPYGEAEMKALVAHELHVLRRAIQHGLGILHFESEGVSDSNAMLVELGKIKPALLIVDIDLPPFGAAQAIRTARGFDNSNE